MASAANNLEEVLNCTICLDIFKDPHILKCLHTVCKSCLEQLKAQSGSGKIKCPECRCVCQSSEIKKDFNKQTLLDLYHKSKEDPSGKTLDSRSTKQAPKQNVCQICSNEVIAWGCQECVKLMCENCKVAHPSIPACSHHIIRDIASITKPFKDQLVNVLPSIQQASQQIATKHDVMVSHRQQLQTQFYTLSKDIDAAENELMQKTKEHFNSLRNRAKKQFETEVSGVDKKDKWIQERLQTLKNRSSEIQTVLNDNDFTKIVYNTKDAVNKVKHEIFQMQMEVQNCKPDGLKSCSVKLHAFPEFQELMTVNIYEEPVLPSTTTTIKGAKVQNSAATKPKVKATRKNIFSVQPKHTSLSVPVDSKGIHERTGASNVCTPLSIPDLQSQLAIKSHLHAIEHEFSQFEEAILTEDKVITVHSLTEPYFKLSIIGREIWCTLSDKIEVYSLDGEYARTIHENDTIGNPYGVTAMRGTNDVIIGSSNGVFQVNSYGKVCQTISQEKFVDITQFVTSTHDKSEVICGINMWKQKAIAFQNNGNKWEKIGEMPIKSDDKEDTIVGNRDYMYICSNSKSVIYKYNIKGELMKEYNMAKSKPHICSMDPRGDALVCDEQKKKIKVLTLEGRFYPLKTEGANFIPASCGVDHTGALWALSKGNPCKLIKFLQSDSHASSEGHNLSFEEREKLLQLI